MPDDRSLRHFLKNGGVIAYPTESIFGLGCDPKCRLGVKRLLKLKGRPQHKGLILISDQLSRLQPYIAKMNQAQISTMEAAWNIKTKPHTWIVPRSKDCPKWLTGRHNSVAIRVTSHALTARLCKNSRMALVSTSANRNGCVPAKTASEVKRLFGRSVMVLNGRTGGASKPSTIQDLISGKIIRK